MRSIAIVLVASLCGSACVDGDTDLSEARTPSDIARATVVSEMSPGTPNVCELLPEDCGACSVACDYDALREYVPVGTCAAFVCELVDGSDAIFHACHPG